MRRPPSSRNLVSTELVALAAGVTEATVRKWASRGKLTRYGRPRRAEYDLDEVLRLIDDTGDAWGRRDVSPAAPSERGGRSGDPGAA